MVDFTAKQLTWIITGACALGGTAYLSVDSRLKAVEQSQVQFRSSLESVDYKINEMSKVLMRIDDRLQKQSEERIRELSKK